MLLCQMPDGGELFDLQAFYERLTPFASTFIALFNRQALPHRSTLSRFLAALDQPTVEALRTLFQEDLVARTAQTFPPDGLWDRPGKHWLVMDVDGTKQAARQRALPSLLELPAPHRGFDQVCAPAYLGRKRGEVARTRTTVLQAHSQHPFLRGDDLRSIFIAPATHQCCVRGPSGRHGLPVQHLLSPIQRDS